MGKLEVEFGGAEEGAFSSGRSLLGIGGGVKVEEAEAALAAFKAAVVRFGALLLLRRDNRLGGTPWVKLVRRAIPKEMEPEDPFELELELDGLLDEEPPVDDE